MSQWYAYKEDLIALALWSVGLSVARTDATLDALYVVIQLMALALAAVIITLNTPLATVLAVLAAVMTPLGPFGPLPMTVVIFVLAVHHSVLRALGTALLTCAVACLMGLSPASPALAFAVALSLAGLLRMTTAAEAFGVSGIDDERTRRYAAEAALRAEHVRWQRRLAQVRDDERARIARDLHDSVGHVLSSALLQTKALVQTTSGADREALIALGETLDRGMTTTREAIHALHRSTETMARALAAVAQRTSGVRVHVAIACDREPTPDARHAFVSVATEALTNVVRHSDATDVHLTFDTCGLWHRLVVRDNGQTTNLPAWTTLDDAHLGLKSLETRLAALGGTLTVRVDRGVVVTALVPFAPPGARPRAAEAEGGRYDHDA